MSEPTTAEVLADLARAKAVFQLRTIKLVIGLPLVDTHAERGDVEQAPSLMSGDGPRSGSANPGQGIIIQGL